MAPVCSLNSNDLSGAYLALLSPLFILTITGDAILDNSAVFKVQSRVSTK